MSDKDIVKAVESAQSSLGAPWDKSGETAEQYMQRLKGDLDKANSFLQGRSSDASMIQSAIEDTLSLVAYVSAQKELHALKAVIQSYVAKEMNHGTVNSEGPDKRG